MGVFLIDSLPRKHSGTKGEFFVSGTQERVPGCCVVFESTAGKASICWNLNQEQTFGEMM